LVPPKVATELDDHFKEELIALQGGPEKAMKSMPLKEYMEGVIAKIEAGETKEIAVGFADMGVKAWRGTFGPILEARGSLG
jgi:hypothetical protein